MERSARLTAAAAIAGAMLAAPDASANGRYPAANQLLVSPVDPRLLVLRLTFGVLVSHDAGGTWDWICEDAVGYGEAGTDEDPAMGAMQSALLAGTEEGLFVSPDLGCSWARAPNVTQWAVDVSVRRDQPSSALALSRTFYGNLDDGGSTYSPALFLTIDEGAAWAPYGAPIDPSVAPETVDVAPSDHRVAYVSGFRVTAGIPHGILLASMNDGATWTPYEVPIDPLADIDVLIGAVDPTNPLRVYLRVVRTTGSRLVVTDDGGKTFRTVFTSSVGMPGFALSPDGSKVYLGGDDGIHVAPAGTLSFSKVSDQRVQCLTASSTALYACAYETDGFVLGASRDDGATFAPLLHMCDIRGPLACAAGTSGAVCTSEWPLTRETIAPDAGPSGCPPADVEGGPDGDAAMADATTQTDASDAGEANDGSSDAGRPAAPHGGCSCAAAGIKGTAEGAVAGQAFLAGLLLARQRDRKLHRPSERQRDRTGRREDGKV